jgi:hypothetical protein
MTTARMLNLGQWAGASTLDLTAIAHSIFAFWRLIYDHTEQLAPHTLHETMDIAQNFGVRYDPRDPHREFRYDDVEARQQELKAEIDHQLGDALQKVEGTAARQDPALREATAIITKFQADYPELPTEDRPAAMTSVLHALVLLAGTDPNR